MAAKPKTIVRPPVALKSKSKIGILRKKQSNRKVNVDVGGR